MRGRESTSSFGWCPTAFTPGRLALRGPGDRGGYGFRGEEESRRNQLLPAPTLRWAGHIEKGPAPCPDPAYGQAGAGPTLALWSGGEPS